MEIVWLFLFMTSNSKVSKNMFLITFGTLRLCDSKKKNIPRNDFDSLTHFEIYHLYCRVSRDRVVKCMTDDS